jgi:thiosulfate/3-mercaptopyruvate sulfurtransferase
MPMLVSAEWLASHASDPKLVVLHVGRDRKEYDAEHLPGARFIALEAVMDRTHEKLTDLPPTAKLRDAFESVGISDDSHVVIYGQIQAAARIWATLDYLGFENAALLDGGLAEWKRQGRPSSTKTPERQRGKLTARHDEAKFVDADWVNRHLHTQGVALIDARSPEEYAGGELGMTMPLGHIPGAQLLSWDALLVSHDRPVFRSTAELRQLMQKAGVAPTDTVVPYCMIGMRASVDYFVARYLGHASRLYDKSWLDWAARGLPRETALRSKP